MANGIGFQGGLSGGQNPFQGQSGFPSLGGGSGGGLDLSSLLGLSGGGNPLVALAGMFGGPLLSGLGSLIGGPSKSQKANRGLLASFNQQLSGPAPDFLNVNKVFGDLQLGLRPEFSKQAQNLSGRLGISSPLAQAGLAQLRSSSLVNLRGGLQQQLAQLQLQNMMNLRQGAVQAAQGV